MKVKFETEKLKQVLVNFYNLTNMRFVIFDENFNKILAYPEESCPFCTSVKNTAAKSKCRQNDTEACEICKKTNSLYTYKCHAGLIEAAAPIRMNDAIIAYIMFGQICEKGQDKDEIYNYAKDYISDSEKLAEYVKKIKFKSEKQITAAANLMEICTCYLCLAELIKIDAENLIFHLSSYIDFHIADNLSVENLCSVFGISRSRLYEVSHKYYGMSIAKYIRKKRVGKALDCFKSKNCSVSRAADTAGFLDYNYFSKVFKAETGMTPSAYKKNLKH